MKAPAHVEASFVKGAARWEQLPDDGLAEVAFAGRSNVGKSSLLNLLLRRKNLARTSNTPGKTQEFNVYRVEAAGLPAPLLFVDLPGYGYAKVSRTERERWGRFIGRYLTEREPLRLCIHLIDSRHPPTAQDRDVIDVMRGSTVPYLIALTKTDKLSGNGRAQSAAAVRKLLKSVHLEVPIVLTSATDGRGRDELWEWIVRLGMVD